MISQNQRRLTGSGAHSGFKFMAFPFGLMTGKIGTILGESIGEVEEVDMEGEQMAWGRYLRLRVVVNITKPLKRGSKLAVASQGSVIVVFKYERLLDFYYICGRLDHQELDYDDVVRMTIVGGKVKREYGPWLRTESNELLTWRKDALENAIVSQETSLKGRRTAWHGGTRQKNSSSNGGGR